MKPTDIPAILIDRPDHHDTQPCPVPGCGGLLDFTTEGAGGIGRMVITCPRCEQRQRQRQRHGWRRAA